MIESADMGGAGTVISYVGINILVTVLVSIVLAYGWFYFSASIITSKAFFGYFGTHAYVRVG